MSRKPCTRTDQATRATSKHILVSHLYGYHLPLVQREIDTDRVPTTALSIRFLRDLFNEAHSKDTPTFKDITSLFAL